jgi:hypothetical protein
VSSRPKSGDAKTSSRVLKSSARDQSDTAPPHPYAGIVSRSEGGFSGVHSSTLEIVLLPPRCHPISLRQNSEPVRHNLVSI